MRIRQVSSFRPNVRYAVTGDALAGHALGWREDMQPGDGSETLARYEDGAPALLRHGRAHYLGCRPDAALLAGLMRRMAAAADLPMMDLPEAVRLRRRGDLTFAVNYGPEPWEVPGAGTRSFVLGKAVVPAQGVAAWRG
jgi:beta-galactosidase